MKTNEQLSINSLKLIDILQSYFALVPNIYQNFKADH